MTNVSSPTDPIASTSDFPPLISSAGPSRQASIHLQDDLSAPSRHSTPPIPPGFEGHAAAGLKPEENSRRSTPVIPPGLGGKIPSALPQLEGEGTISRPGSRPGSRLGMKRAASSAVVVPVVPLKPSGGSRPGTPGPVVKVEGKEKEKAKEEVVVETPTKDPKAKGKGKERHVEEEMKPAKAVDETSTKKEDALPAPATEPVKQRKASAPTAMQPAGKGQATVQASTEKAAPVTPTKPEKENKKKDKQHPGKLDITAAVNKRDEAVTAAAAKVTLAEVATPTKQTKPVSRTPSVASKPESPNVASPAPKTAPRTLRVVQTPKAETPPPQPPLATPSLPAISSAAAAGKMPSRQPSLASINPPGTPSSEQISISDNISMTSTSQSRANSPPPPGTGKVGPAPVRAKTKSQMKKERQERAKLLEEERLAKAAEESPAPVAEEQPVVEAIVSRKKKARKEKEAKPAAAKKSLVKETETAETTPTVSRAPSPSPTSKVEEQSKPATPIAVQGPQPPPHMMPSPHEPSPPPTPTLTAASLLADLKAQAPEIQKCVESLFRTPNAQQYKPSQNLTPKDLQNPAFWKSDFKINLTKDEVEALLSGALPAVHYGGNEGRIWDRGMVTQTGAHLRALTEELETRFLELEKALRETPQELRFRSGKPQNEMRFPSIDLERLKRELDVQALGGGAAAHGGQQQRGPSVMEQMVQDGSAMKKGAFLVDEAGRYVDEFVMPPVTPPPSAGKLQGQQQGQASAGAEGGVQQEKAPMGLDVSERALAEAKKGLDESEGRLRKVIKKNRRLLGL